MKSSMKTKSVDVFFLNGPFLKGFSRESRSPAVTKSGTLYYPGWLAYGCGYLEERGQECFLYDSIASNTGLDEALALIASKQPKLLVLGTSTPSIEADIATALAAKEAGVPYVCLVGTHASSTAAEILENNQGIDFVARREFDETLLELIEMLKSEVTDFSKILGLSYRVDSTVVHNDQRPYIEDLDSLPFASKYYAKYLDISNYYYGHVKYPMVSIWTSRGCDAKCTYCVYPQTMFGNFRHRSPENIAAEFVWIKENLPHVKEVLIDDDTFTMNRKHAREASQALIDVGNKIPWTCEARATLDTETLRLMKKAGCRLIVTGFESISQDVLNSIKKGVKQTRVEKFVASAKEVNLKIHGCFMAGNPGDTFETLHATLDWAIKHNFDTAQFFPLQLYPGTSAFDAAKSEGRLVEQPYSDWVSDDGMHSMTLIANDTGLTKEQAVEFCNYARKKFYLRPAYILKKSMDIFYDFDEFKKNVKGFINIRKHLIG